MERKIVFDIAGIVGVKNSDYSEEAKEAIAFWGPDAGVFVSVEQPEQKKAKEEITRSK